MPTMQPHQLMIKIPQVEQAGHPQANQGKNKSSGNSGRQQNRPSVQGIVPSHIQVGTESKCCLSARPPAYVAESARAPMPASTQAQPVPYQKVPKGAPSKDETVPDSQEEDEGEDRGEDEDGGEDEDRGGEDDQDYDGYHKGYDEGDEDDNRDLEFNLNSQERREIEMDPNAGEQEDEVSGPNLDLLHSA